MKARRFSVLPACTLVLAILFSSCDKQPLNNCTITGRVLFNGDPIRATVQLFSREINQQVVSQTDGRFTFSQITRGDYTLHAVHTISTHVSGGALVQVNSDGETVNVEVLTRDNFVSPGGGGGGGSCPYIYLVQADQKILKGDIFPGAIYPNLQRDDFFPLMGIADGSRKVTVEIANELRERQYTDLARLLLVAHGAGEVVTIDKYGQPWRLNSSQSPLSAKAADGSDVSELLSAQDGQSFFFNVMPAKEPGVASTFYKMTILEESRNNLVLTFNLPAGATDARLLVKAKNTRWSEIMFYELVSAFGNYYNTWREKQHQKPAGDLQRQRIDEAVPLLVYVKKNGDWILADYFELAGAVRLREQVLPLCVTADAEGKVEIMLQSAFNFWELDQVALDCTPAAKLKVDTLLASSIINNGQQVADSRLDHADGNFLEHLNTGEKALVSYELPFSFSESVHSVFLHSRGYYEQVVETEESPDYFALLRFAIPGSFASHCKERYRQLHLQPDALTNRSVRLKR